MSTRDPGGPVDHPADPPREAPGEPSGESGPPVQSAAPKEAHDPSGLDLARSVADAYRGRGGIRRRRSMSGDRPRSASQSGAHPDDRDPQPVRASVERLVSEQGWTTDLAVHALFARWDTIVGAEVAQHCRPRHFADAELVVTADSTAWATQVRLLAPTVVRRLNEELGHGTVTRVVVEGPQGPSWRRGRRSVRDGRGPRDTYG